MMSLGVISRRFSLLRTLICHAVEWNDTFYETDILICVCLARSKVGERRPKEQVDMSELIQLEGKTAVIFGLANKRSIAWGIALKLREGGAKLAICYQNERMKAEAQGLIDELPGAEGFQCDVSSDAEITTLFDQLRARYG